MSFSTRADGKLSEKPRLPSAGLPLGFCSVNASTVVPPVWIVVGLNDFPSVGAIGLTLRQLGWTPFWRLPDRFPTLFALFVKLGAFGHAWLICCGWLVTVTTIVHERPAPTDR